MRITLICFFISLFAQFGAFAQNVSKKGFPPSVPIKELAMDTWTNDNGLVSNNVNAVFQFSDDFIWITSYNGLQKFDGHRFIIYDQTNLDFLNSNAVNSGTETLDGKLIFCSQSSGVFQYNGDQFSPLSINEDIPSAITSVFSDSRGTLWLGTTNNGLYKAEIEGRVTKEQLIPNVTIHDIIEDKQGNIWLASDGLGVFKIKPDGVENFTEKSGLTGNLTMSLGLDKNNTVYVGSVSGLNAIKGKNVIPFPLFNGTIINDILPDDYGMLWVGTDRGLMRYDQETAQLEIFDESNGLPGDRVVKLCFDTEGSLWVGTYETGLVRFKAGMFQNLTIRDGLSTNQIYSIGYNEGKYYIGSQDGKINILENGKFSKLPLEKRFEEDVIRDFMFDEDGIWVSNYMGLANIGKDGVKYYNEANGLPTNSIRKMYKSRDGTFWLATRAGGLVKFNKNGKFDIYDKGKGLLSNYILTLGEDEDGNLLIGTNAGGLSVLTKSGVLENYNINGDDSGTIIFNLKVIDNQILLCTNLGLFVFANEQFTAIPFDGLKTQKIFDLVYDKLDSYWLTSNIGVIKVRKGDIGAYLQKDIETVPYELFGEEDGMESQECTGATSSFFDQATGNIWIPTYEGVAILKPSLKITNKRIPKVFITGMQVDNYLINPVGGEVIVQPGNFRYLFDVTSLSFLAPSKVQFKYRLDGIEKDWNGPTTNRRIEYTNLPYGSYTLKVIGSNNDGIWNMEGDSLSFKVRPYFFETNVFKIMLVLVIVAIFYLLYRWRIRDIRRTNKVLTKMNAELDRFVYSASHDLRGPLTTIMGVINMAISQNKELGNDQYFKMIKLSTDKMDHFINELINYAKNKNDAVIKQPIRLSQLTDTIVAELDSFRAEKGVIIQKEIESDFMVESDERRLNVILKNLIHNAISFSKPGSGHSFVTIYATRKEGGITIGIRDNGVGIDDKIRDKIFDMFFRGNDQSQGSGLGLYVVKDTCEKLNASIEVISRPRDGSEFIVTLHD